MPAVLISRSKPAPLVPNHAHQDTTERFINRPDITFQRCKSCGRKTYPPGFFKVGDGATTTILWPT